LFNKQLQISSQDKFSYSQTLPHITEKNITSRRQRSGQITCWVLACEWGA